MHLNFTRRGALIVGASAVTTASWARSNSDRVGRVTGHPVATTVGEDVLRQGGNVYDAIVAAAFTAAVAAPYQCGPCGYGGSFISSSGVVVDFNSTAPQASSENMFAADAQGNVRGNTHLHGWLAAGVPGILAGLEHILKRFGTWKLSNVLRPAIDLARDGIRVDDGLRRAVMAAKANFAKDPASAEIYLPGGSVPEVGSTLKNPELSKLLQGFADAQTTADFYHGESAKRVAAAFKSNGGLVNARDLASYTPIECQPVTWQRGAYTISTPPPTAGGITVLQALAVLDKLDQSDWRVGDLSSARALIETMRLCWDDRLHRLGDPQQPSTVPPVAWPELLDHRRLVEQAAKVAESLKSGKPVRATSDGLSAGGTIHLSAVDAQGNFAALTLTHGGGFGAQVTVPGLGVTLGHGMSRFDPRPGHPNSPGPGKRPLHNMCASIVSRDNQPIMAIGGRGGRRIPNAILHALYPLLFCDQPIRNSLTSPRMHSEGDLRVVIDSQWTDDVVQQIAHAGYATSRSAIAVVSAAWRDGENFEALTR